MVKVILDRAQSGGDQISICNDEDIVLVKARIADLPEKDGIVVIDTSKVQTDLIKGGE